VYRAKDTQLALQYLRFVLLNVASLDHHPAAVPSFECQTVKQFGLNIQEFLARDPRGTADAHRSCGAGKAGHTTGADHRESRQTST